MARLSTTEAAATHEPGFCCPNCRDPLGRVARTHLCRRCGCSYPIIDGFPSFVGQRVEDDGFDASTYQFLFKMEQKHFWHVGRREMILDVLRRNTHDLISARMLEIGCGNGSVLAYLMQNDVRVEGGDVFLEGLRYCQKRVPSALLYQVDVLALPFKDEFDTVGAFDVLEHIDDDDRALTEINTVLKPGGTLILTVPAHGFLWSSHDEASHHRRRYGRTELVAKLEHQGFTVTRETYWMFFLFPVMAVMRLLRGAVRRRRPETVSTQTCLEFRTIPVINDLFLSLLRLEKRLIRHLNLPFGASLLVIATKKDA